MMTSGETALLARCTRMGSSTWSDAIDSLGISGALHGIVRRGGEGVMAGLATTARHSCGSLGEFDRAEFAVGELIAATGPGRVLMVDMGGATISTFGGLAAQAAKRRQATGVVIDGGCRDLDEIEATSLWLASRWVTPVTGKTRLKLEALGEQVTIGGVIVNEGDLVVGDGTGIVVVPRAYIARTLEEAERIVAIDLALEHGIQEGKSFTEAAAAADYISPRK